MKKLIISLVLALTLVSLMAVPVFAAGPTVPAGKSGIAQLYLYEKDPTDWSIVEGGAWGKMTYKLSEANLECVVFNGHQLEANTEYSLIKYTDPWPGTPVVVIAAGTSNRGGNINLKGSADLGAFGTDINGYKIWLVLTSDITGDGGSMKAWNPTEYLFEYDLIR